VLLQGWALSGLQLKSALTTLTSRDRPIRYTFRRGRIMRVDAFFGPNRADAVEAIGVQ
jgi:hypothetical protein